MYIHTHNGVVFSQEKKGRTAVFNSMDGIVLQGIMLSRISQTEKDKYYMLSLICRI